MLGKYGITFEIILQIDEFFLKLWIQNSIFVPNGFITKLNITISIENFLICESNQQIFSKRIKILTSKSWRNWTIFV